MRVSYGTLLTKVLSRADVKRELNEVRKDRDNRITALYRACRTEAESRNARFKAAEYLFHTEAEELFETIEGIIQDQEM